MLYDNAQFILLLSKYCKINSDNYFKDKLEQTIEFLKKISLIKRVFLGLLMMQIAMEKKENIIFILIMRLKISKY